MRDPERIKRILELIKKRWEKHPDQRFFQLLMNYTCLNDKIESGKIKDPFYIEDEKLEKELMEALEEDSEGYHKVLINFKICDNAQECNGIEACPTGAFHWEDETIAIDENKCIRCERCGSVCMVDAIKIAHSIEEHKKIQEEYDNDPRKVSDLFIDRYGAQPIHPAFQISEDKFEKEVLGSKTITMVEVYEPETLMCLLKSIPIRELVSGENIKYRKIRSTGSLQRYTKTLPSLLFFSQGKMFGKIEGFYEDKEKMKEMVKEILDKA